MRNRRDDGAITGRIVVKFEEGNSYKVEIFRDSKHARFWQRNQEKFHAFFWFGNMGWDVWILSKAMELVKVVSKEICQPSKATKKGSKD